MSQKKHSVKIVAALLATVLASGMLAGCGGAKETPSATPSTPAESTAENKESPAEKDSGEQLTIQVSVSGSTEEMALRKEISDLYTAEHPNTTIEWIDLGNERLQKTMTLIGSGQAPDIMYVNEKVFALADLNVLEPLDEYINADAEFNLDSFYPNLLEVLRYNEKLYGLPQEISPFVVFYNKTMFEEKGVALPTDDWTKDDFYEAAKALTDPEQKIYGYRHPTNWPDQITGWFSREGVDLYNEDATATALDQPGTLEALKYLEKMVVTDKISPDPADSQAMGKGFDAMFRNQKVAMQMAGLWDLPVFKEQPLDFEWDVAMVPKGVNQNTKAGVLNWCISADSKNKDAAWDIVKFFVGSEGQRVVAEHNMALPSNRDEAANQIILDSKFPANVKVFIDSVENVEMRDQLSPHREEVLNVISSEVDLLLLGQQSAEETQEKIVAQANDILSQ